MQAGRIQGATRVLGKSQGFIGLPIRDGIAKSVLDQPDVPYMTSAWLPTPKELDALNKGAAVHVRIVGTQHPPIAVEVGEIPE